MTAEDYEDVIRQLGTQGVLGEEQAQHLRGLGGFRNLLVHGYLRLDAERVLERLRQAPRDFSDFAVAVRAWLEEIGG